MAGLGYPASRGVYGYGLGVGAVYGGYAPGLGPVVGGGIGVGAGDATAVALVNSGPAGRALTLEGLARGCGWECVRGVWQSPETPYEGFGASLATVSIANQLTIPSLKPLSCGINSYTLQVDMKNMNSIAVFGVGVEYFRPPLVQRGQVDSELTYQYAIRNLGRLVSIMNSTMGTILVTDYRNIVQSLFNSNTILGNILVDLDPTIAAAYPGIEWTQGSVITFKTILENGVLQFLFFGVTREPQRTSTLSPDVPPVPFVPLTIDGSIFNGTYNSGVLTLALPTGQQPAGTTGRIGPICNQVLPAILLSATLFGTLAGNPAFTVTANGVQNLVPYWTGPYQAGVPRNVSPIPNLNSAVDVDEFTTSGASDDLVGQGGLITGLSGFVPADGFFLGNGQMICPATPVFWYYINSSGVKTPFLPSVVNFAQVGTTTTGGTNPTVIANLRVIMMPGFEVPSGQNISPFVAGTPALTGSNNWVSSIIERDVSGYTLELIYNLMF